MSIQDIFNIASMSDADQLRLALAQGIDPNAPHPRAGTLLLHIACASNAVDCIRILLDAGADPNRQFTRTSRVDGRVLEDHYPLMSATSVEAAAMMVAAGARLDLRDGRGWTPLVCAISSGRVDLCKFYLEHGARTDIRLFWQGEELSLMEYVDGYLNYFVTADPSVSEKTRPMIESLEKIRALIIAHNAH